MGYKDTKLYLKEEDISMLSDTSFFKKKQLLTHHIIALFGDIESTFNLELKQQHYGLPEKILIRRGKISRGENYQGLPYVILDYPAIFEKDAIFAFRTLMWWGHPFSFTFHLAGNYLNQYLENLYPKLDEFDNQTLICVNSNQWEHHHEKSNYLTLHEFRNRSENSLDFFKSRGFLKLSKTIPLDEHLRLIPEGLNFLNSILNCLK